MGALSRPLTGCVALGKSFFISGSFSTCDKTVPFEMGEIILDYPGEPRVTQGSSEGEGKESKGGEGSKMRKEADSSVMWPQA